MNIKIRLLHWLVGLFVLVHIGSGAVFAFREGLDWWDLLLFAACVGCWFGSFWALNLIEKVKG